MKYGYARVSTKDQVLNLQMDALQTAGCHKIFYDRLSMLANQRTGSTNSGRRELRRIGWRFDEFANQVCLADFESGM